MKSHRYKLATLVLSTGLLLGACGGEEEAQAPEDPEEVADTAVEEDEGTGTTDQSTDTSDDAAEEADTSDDSAGESTDDMEDTSDTTTDTSSDNTDSTSESEETESTEGEADEDTETTEPTGVAVLDQLGSTPEEAVSAAQENFDGELMELELDQEDGDWVYKVSMENESEEYEAKMLAEDLSVISEETESNDGMDANDVFAYEDAIPHDEAVRTAMDEVGGELEGWTLDKDDGQLEYEIELMNTDAGGDAEVKINAESGEILETDD
ncbi:PepSY domain-containing protein [Salinicoccus halitifaciens]|uniref:Membrane protein YkoI n=1 Tax=Salinicoccus halitifaciens TaxID=1073415 RepID=A0ABV2EC27_9STAP|nr:PepSY domain-containing protein [Salinicoccus halitifaciens]MCD2138450.1 PepSY domain-containing protein [Salinicoccus halitifaciens]